MHTNPIMIIIKSFDMKESLGLYISSGWGLPKDFPGASGERGLGTIWIDGHVMLEQCFRFYSLSSRH